jgi:hypothetical protein
VLTGMLYPEPGERPTMKGVAASLAHLETQPLDEQRTVPVRPPAPAVVPVPPAVGPTRSLPRLEPAQERRRRPNRIVLIVVLVLVFAVAGVLTTMVINSARHPGTASGPPSSSSAPPATRGGSSTAAVAVQGPINWSQAGQLVIDYYNGMDNPQATWAMLGKGGRAAFGDQRAFEQYWKRYKQVSARNARGVTPNPDGSVNVPVDVTYTGSDGATRQEHRVLHVVIEDGRLVIDSDAK